MDFIRYQNHKCCGYVMMSSNYVCLCYKLRDPTWKFVECSLVTTTNFCSFYWCLYQIPYYFYSMYFYYLLFHFIYGIRKNNLLYINTDYLSYLNILKNYILSNLSFLRNVICMLNISRLFLILLTFLNCKR